MNAIQEHSNVHVRLAARFVVDAQRMLEEGRLDEMLAAIRIASRYEREYFEDKVKETAKEYAESS